MKYGICYCYWSRDWEGTDYPVKIERARKCGFDVLEIFFGRVLTMQQKEIDNILAACRANDIEMYCVGGFGREQDLSQSDPEGRKIAVEKAKELIRAISRIGAKNLSGINYCAWCNFDKPINKQERMENAAKALCEVGAFAADYGVSWNMEVVNRFETYMLNTAKEGRALADAAGSRQINLLLDTFHGMVEEDDLAAAIITAGDRLGHYHVGSNNRNLPHAGGFLPWAEIGRALRKIGYNKCVSFEPLVHTGGTVAEEGGSVWRPMLPQNATDEMLDRMLMESLRFIKQNFEA
jgi:D-psicose/D-tagatose/L-ribulose 3-epimerase